MTRWPGRKSRPFSFARQTLTKFGPRKIGGGPAVCFRRAPLLYQPTCKPGSVGHMAELMCVTAIPLGRRLPGASSNLPGRQDPDIDPEGLLLRAVPIRSCSRWGLPCRRRCRRRGALLPHLFTLTATIRYVPRRLFSVALSLKRCPERLGPAGRYPAPFDPWSPDFPPRRPFGPCRSGRPAD